LQVLDNALVDRMDEAPDLTAAELRPMGLTPYNEKVGGLVAERPSGWGGWGGLVAVWLGWLGG
jgi:hypothetical protein